ncbi:hypothetical protein AcW2_007678 [Taiwanofungus camphoratus]|nr:hypothetical protein AcW2_007678 [Antrodia cinnamomea]
MLAFLPSVSVDVLASALLAAAAPAADPHIPSIGTTIDISSSPSLTTIGTPSSPSLTTVPVPSSPSASPRLWWPVPRSCTVSASEGPSSISASAEPSIVSASAVPTSISVPELSTISIPVGPSSASVFDSSISSTLFTTPSSIIESTLRTVAIKSGIIYPTPTVPAISVLVLSTFPLLRGTEIEDKQYASYRP